MGAGMRYQPQGLARLSRSRMFAGAQAIIHAPQRVNLVSQKPLMQAGTVSRQGTGGGLAFQFRKNGYAQTEVLPAIGTASFIEFWYGTPIAYGSGGSGTEAAFLTGSNTNANGICANGRGGAPNWGVILTWPTILDSGEVLPLGVRTVIVQARYQDRVEMWRDGRLVKSVATAAYSFPAETLIVGSFIEDTGYWSSSSDTIMAGRVLGEWSADEIRQFSQNPWIAFAEPEDDDLYAAAVAGNVIGTLSSTLSPATMSAVGALSNAGIFASSLANASMSASGSVATLTPASGAFASTLGNAAMSVAGATTDAGIFASALAGATMTANGGTATAPYGTLASTLAGCTMNAAGVAINRGALTALMADATLSATGAAAPHATGTFAATMQGASMFANGYLGNVAPADPVRHYRWRVLRRHFSNPGTQ